MKENKILWGGMIIAIIFSLIGFLNSLDKDISINALLDQNNQNTITVSGEAEKMVKPDTASVSFTLTKRSMKLSLATKSVNDRMAALLKSLDDFGVEEKDIKTLSYNVNPEYDWSSSKRVFIGYRVSQRISVKIRDLDKVEKVLSTISTLKVDNVSGLSFFIDDDKEIKEELRGEAIADAKKKADKLANELGVSLGKIVSFNENNNNYHPIYRSYEMKAMPVSADGGSAQIPTGENTLKSKVSITYRLK